MEAFRSRGVRSLVPNPEVSMRLLILCTFSMVVGVSSVPAGSAHARVPSPALPLAEVPFTLHQNAVILPALINERDTVQLLLDTGWGPLALVSSSAKRLGLHPKGSTGTCRE